VANCLRGFLYFVLLLSGGFLGAALALKAEPDRLPYPRALYHKVEFWKSIYTQYGTSQGILHDSEDLSIVYEDVQLPPNGNQAIVSEKRAKIRQALFNILSKRGQNLTTFERKVLSKFPKYASRSRLLQAAENIRFQLGQADRFKQGLIRSGRYLPTIEKILKDEGAPDFLKYLPHVESSFQEKAMSKYGAAGLWQLMPKTGKQFIRVDYAVDERLDPWLASRAAAKYLLSNYKRLGEWPLAITAYNHGAGGVQRAVSTLGTTDIAEIAFQYSTPSFGFASRNFYTQFLAAVQVAQDYKKYFGELPIEKTPEFDEIRLDRAMYFRDLAAKYRFSLEDFQNLNLGIRKPVYQNLRPLPKSQLVRLPKGAKKAVVLVASLDKKAIVKDEAGPKQAELLAVDSATPKVSKLSTPIEKKSTKIREVGKSEPIEPKTPELDEDLMNNKYDVRDFAAGKAWVEVEINETISQMAEWLGVNTDELRQWNGMESRSQVRLGQRLLLKFEKHSPQNFVRERTDFHKQIREDFFSQFQIESFIDYSVQSGENLWSLCFQKFDLPPWLLEQFNPSINLSELKPGTKLKIPVLKETLSVASDSTSN